MVRSTAEAAGSGGAAGGPGARSRSRASPGLRRGTCTGPGRRAGPASSRALRVRNRLAPRSVQRTPEERDGVVLVAAVGHHRGEAAEILEVDRLCRGLPRDQPIPQRVQAPAVPGDCSHADNAGCTFHIHHVHLPEGHLRHRATGYSRPPRPTVEQRLLPSSLTVDDLEQRRKTCCTPRRQRPTATEPGKAARSYASTHHHSGYRGGPNQAPVRSKRTVGAHARRRSANETRPSAVRVERLESWTEPSTRASDPDRSWRPLARPTGSSPA